MDEKQLRLHPSIASQSMLIHVYSIIIFYISLQSNIDYYI